jgi:hypothetical protein
MYYLFGLVLISFLLFLYGWVKDGKDTISNDDSIVANPKNDAMVIKCPSCADEVKADTVKCEKCGSLLNVF